MPSFLIFTTRHLQLSANDFTIVFLQPQRLKYGAITCWPYCAKHQPVSNCPSELANEIMFLLGICLIKLLDEDSEADQRQ